MTIEEYRAEIKNRTREKYPEIWSFFDGVAAFGMDDKNDPECRRWQATLQLAYLIGGNVDYRLSCKPGEMHSRYSTSYRDHNSEDGYEFRENSVRLLDEETFLCLKERDGEDERMHPFEFERIFYLDKDAFEDDLTFVRPQERSYNRYRVTFVARVKGLGGYYLFDYVRS